MMGCRVLNAGCQVQCQVHHTTCRAVTPLLPRAPGVRDSSRSSGRCGEEAWIRGSVGTRSTPLPSARHGYGVWRCASSNVVVLDWAFFSSQLSALSDQL